MSPLAMSELYLLGGGSSRRGGMARGVAGGCHIRKVPYKEGASPLPGEVGEEGWHEELLRVEIQVRAPYLMGGGVRLRFQIVHSV